MRIEQTTHEGAAIVHVDGRIDAGGAPEIESTLVALSKDGPGAVILDLSMVDYVSSLGLRAMLVAIKALSESGRRFFIAGPNADVLDVFTLTGFSKILSIHASVEAALAEI